MLVNNNTVFPRFFASPNFNFKRNTESRSEKCLVSHIMIFYLVGLNPVLQKKHFFS